MTTRYSPSPWRNAVSRTCPDVWEIRADFCESPIAEVPRWQDDDGTDSPEAIANVAILAAAPRMYETLAFVADMLSSMKPDFLRQIGLDAALAEALVALETAEGLDVSPAHA